MERLKGKDILIGKEPNKHRLLIAVKKGGQIKTTTIGEEGSVPNCVSRCKPAENIAHCKISIGQDGKMVIHNLKSENTTYVNGFEIDERRITNQCNISLGKDQYLINVKKILDMVRSMTLQEESLPSGYSIRHLQRVWEKYDNDVYKLQKRQKNLGLIKSLYMPCTVLSGLIGFVFKHVGIENGTTEIISMVMYIIAAIVLFYGLYKTFTDRSIEERKMLDKKFQEDYVCPKCKRFLGVKPYNILRQDEHCPYNKCKWIE